MKWKSCFSLGAVALVAALSACREAPAASEDTSYRTRPGYVIDSVRPLEVELARFREGLGTPPTELTGGATSIDSLIARFARAVSAKDSAALDRLQITKAEFAWLIYPVSPFTKPPYRETPQMLWYMLRTSGDAGMNRLLARRGGQPLAITSHQCPPV